MKCPGSQIVGSSDRERNPLKRVMRLHHCNRIIQDIRFHDDGKPREPIMQAHCDQTARRRLRLSNGAELAYVTAGNVSNPALLLLHGFPSSARTFRHLIPALSRDTYVIAPDLPGHGQSDMPPIPSFAAFGDAISELLAHLSIERRFIYLHDWGRSRWPPDRYAGPQTGFGPHHPERQRASLRLRPIMGRHLEGADDGKRSGRVLPSDFRIHVYRRGIRPPLEGVIGVQTGPL
jgi:hypothetical protein